MGGITVAPQKEIFAPANVELQGQDVVWQMEYQGAMQRPGNEKKVKVEGCLQALAALSEGGQDRVLSFIRTFGPLGIFPVVETLNAPSFCHEWPKRHWTWPESAWGNTEDDKQLNEWGGVWSRRYAEPIAIYQHLASVAHSIMSIADALEKGDRPRREDLIGSVPQDEHEQVSSLLRAQPEGVLVHIQTVAIEWQGVATYRALIRASESASSMIYFGSVDEAWDALPERRKAMEQLRGSLSNYATLFPHHNQRRSPLFNALTYHLVQEVMFPEDGYFCAYCHRFYRFDPENNPDHFNRNRPRSDKKSWCTQDCQDAYDKEYDHQKYLNRKRRKSQALK